MQISKQLIDRFRHNPDQYDEEVLKHKPWSKEKEILQAVGKYEKVAIGSGNIVGKTYTLSDLVLWFAPLFPQSKIITTAPTERQVKDQLWSEISKKHSEVKDVIGGRLTMKRLDFGGIRMFGVNVDNKGRRYARACNKVMSGVDF